MHRRRSRSRTALALSLALALLVGACGGGDDGDDAGGGGGGGDDDLAASCPVGAIEEAGGGPVEITFWHSMVSANGETLQRLTDRFNAEQQDVRVKLVNQTSYRDTLTKYRAALGGGALPDLVQIQDVDSRLVIDSQSVLPAQACVEATDFDMSDLVERVRSYYTIEDVLWPVPFSVSNPILYYNKKAFAKAGLDPNDPPSTLEEVRAAAEKIVQSGAMKYGLSLKQDAWYPEEWLAMAGELYADNGNGREGRATKVLFAEPPGIEIAKWISGMAKDNLAQLTDPENFDNLLSIGNEVAAMTVDTSAALGTIVQVLGSGQFPNVELGAGPLPGPDGDGGTIPAGSALFIVSRSSEAKQEAAWKFASWLTLTDQTAEWAQGTGYIPIRTSAETHPTITELWRTQPFFKVAYDQITSGVDNLASAGPMIGDMEAVRVAVEDALSKLFRGADPTATFTAAAKAADEAIADYESRIGG